MSYCLSKASLKSIAHNFPKVRPELLLLVQDCIKQVMLGGQRLPNMKLEYLELAGLCCVVSYKVMELLKQTYPQAELVQGLFVLDKHPRFSKEAKIASRHGWLQIDDKIVDFTVQQFQAFVNEQLPQVNITNIDDPRYQSLSSDYRDVMLDEDVLFKHYVEKL